MDGLFVNGKRPASKKAVKEAFAADPNSVVVECTSFFGGYSGPIVDKPSKDTVTFVGPDPYNKRNFYGNITWNAAKGKWVIS